MNAQESLRIVLNRIFDGIPEEYIEAIAVATEEKAAQTGANPFEVLKSSSSEYVNPMVFDITGLTEPERA